MDVPLELAACMTLVQAGAGAYAAVCVHAGGWHAMYMYEAPACN